MRMPQATNGTNCLLMAPVPSAAGNARRFAEAVLKFWGIPDLDMTVNLVVSELVTNAIDATGVAIEHPVYGAIIAGLDPVGICLYRRDGLVVVEVWDASTRPPKMRRALPTDEGGRGMVLVEAVTEAWGFRWPKTGGKIVWCTVKAN